MIEINNNIIEINYYESTQVQENELEVEKPDITVVVPIYNKSEYLSVEKTLKVTVLMAVYNGEKYLNEAIESILMQTYEDFEFLIINDGSIDTSRKIIISYDDPRIIIVDNKINIGLSRSLNNGISLSRGKYIARMDADDISVPDRLAKQVEFMENNKEVAVCGSCADIIDTSGDMITDYCVPEKDDEIKITLFFYNPIIHPSVLMRKSCVDQLNTYDEKYSRAQDYELWIRMFFKEKKFYNIQDKLLLYRRHSTSVTKTNIDEQLLITEKILQKLYQDYLKGDYSKVIKIMRRLLVSDKGNINLRELYLLHNLFAKLRKSLDLDSNINDTSRLNLIYNSFMNLINEKSSLYFRLANKHFLRVFGGI